MAWGLLPALFAFTPIFALFSKETRASDRPWIRALRRLALLDAFAFAALGLLVGGAVRERMPSPFSAGAVSGGSAVGLLLQRANGGVRVAGFAAASSAERDGVQRDDVLATLNGQPLLDPRDFDAELARPGPRLRTLGFMRGSQFATLRLTSPTVTAATLFKPLGVERKSTLLHELLGWSLALLALLFIALWSGRRGERRGPLVTLACLAFATVCGGLVARLAESSTRGLSFGSVLIGQVVLDAALIGVGLLLVSPADAEHEPAPGVVQWGLLYGLGISTRLAIVGSAVLLFLPRTFPRPWSPISLFSVLPASGAALLALTAVVLAPAGEELIFRGILQPSLRKIASAPVAIALTALPFALLHTNYGPLALQTFGLGCVLGWARERTGAMAAPIVLHASLNAFALLLGTVGKGLFD